MLDKPIRLKGEKLRKLCRAVYERDEGMCVYCGRYVEQGAKPHHEPPKSRGGQDIAGNMVLLCYNCHQERHGGELQNKIKEFLEKYLNDK